MDTNGTVEAAAIAKTLDIALTGVFRRHVVYAQNHNVAPYHLYNYRTKTYISNGTPHVDVFALVETEQPMCSGSFLCRVKAAMFSATQRADPSAASMVVCSTLTDLEFEHEHMQQDYAGNNVEVPCITTIKVWEGNGAEGNDADGASATGSLPQE